jgi:hypothetical protein
VKIFAVLRFLIFGMMALFAAVPSFAQVYHVRAGASGDGSDWNNAFPALPATLVRGATYYVADGTYAKYVFNTPASGGAVITIKKATESDHGSNTGWQQSYGDGQAVFGAMLHFVTSDWIFDGGRRNDGDWFDGASYGFKVIFSDHNQQVKIGSLGGNPAHNITLDRVFIQAPTDLPTTQTVRQYAIDTESAAPANKIVIRRCFVKNGNNSFFLRNSNAPLVEYCAAQDQQNNSANHAETFNLYYNVPNAVIRYNNIRGFCTASGGTAIVAITYSGGLQFYGNVVSDFWCGDGVVGYIGYYSHNNRIFNNTFVNGRGNAGMAFGSGTGNIIRNNLWINCGFIYFHPGAENHDFNAYSDGSSGNAYSEPNIQKGLDTSIFVNHLSKDFRIAKATAPGLTLDSLFSKDLLNKSRGADGSWDRGAYEFIAGPADTQAPSISGIQISSLTSKTVTIEWVTDEVSNGNLEYGVTTTYGQAIVSSNLATEHSVQLTGLNPDTLYHFRIRSTDPAGNTVTSADMTFRTLLGDTVPPSVTLISPPDGATLNRIVAIEATASDNVGVADVSFIVDGNKVRSDNSLPFTFNWDSTSVSNGIHVLWVEARDVDGNVSRSSTNSITIENPPDALPEPNVYWSFDSESTLDSISSNNLTLRNGAALAVGKFGSALSLDGVDDRAEAPNSTSLDLGSDSMSVSAWVRLQSQGPWQQIVAKVNQTGTLTPPYFAWHLFGSHVSDFQWRPQFQIATTIGSVNVSSSTPFNYGDWLHVTGVYDGASIRIYVNGQLEGSVSHSGNLLRFSQPIYIGAHGLPGEFAKGAIDEVRIFAGALSPTQAAALHSLVPAGFAKEPSSPTGLRLQ